MNDELNSAAGNVNANFFRTIAEALETGPGRYTPPAYIQDGVAYYFDILVGDITENPNINLLGAGIEGAWADLNTYYLNYENNQENLENAITFVPRGSYYATDIRWPSGVANILNEISNTYNGGASSFVGFSYSAEVTLASAADYAMQTNNNTCAVIVESCRVNPLVLTDGERDALINSNVLVVNAFSSVHPDRSLFEHIDNCDGVHVLDVMVNFKNFPDDPHGTLYDLLLENHILDISNGGFSFDDLPNTFAARRLNGRIFDVDYQFTEHYIDEYGNYTSRSLTLLEASQLLINQQYGNTPLTVVPSAVMGIYSHLRSLEDFSLSDAYQMSGNMGPISSYLPFVISSMNALRSQIRSSNFLSSLTFPTFRSSTGIPGCINTYINAYYDMVGGLLDSLASETEAIKSMAEAYEAMESNIESQQL